MEGPLPSVVSDRSSTRLATDGQKLCAVWRVCLHYLKLIPSQGFGVWGLPVVAQGFSQLGDTGVQLARGDTPILSSWLNPRASIPMVHAPRLPPMYALWGRSPPPPPRGRRRIPVQRRLSHARQSVRVFTLTFNPSAATRSRAAARSAFFFASQAVPTLATLVFFCNIPPLLRLPCLTFQ